MSVLEAPVEQQGNKDPKAGKQGKLRERGNKRINLKTAVETMKPQINTDEH